MERLVTILAKMNMGLLDSIINAIVEEAWGRHGRLEELVWLLLDNWRDALSMILPVVPQSRSDMAKYLPLIRRRNREV